MSIDVSPEATAEEVKHPPRITTTCQAREARRLARLGLIGVHDARLRALRLTLDVTDPAMTEHLAGQINHHFDRMEYHLDMLEAAL